MSFNRSPFSGKAFVSAALFLVLFVAGCTSRAQIADVTKPETIELKKNPSQGHVHGISITASGTLDGTAEIQLMREGTVYQKKEISGKFSFAYDGDWYAEQAEIRYLPRNVSGGNIRFRYAFRAL
jgi:hypothetical protein